MIYSRPGSHKKEFKIEEFQDGKNKSGRVGESFIATDRTLKAVLAEADPREKEEWKQLTHPITHTLVQDGPPLAKKQDRLIFQDRHFYIKGANDVGSLGLKTIYSVEEKRGLYELLKEDQGDSGRGSQENTKEYDSKGVSSNGRA